MKGGVYRMLTYGCGIATRTAGHQRAERMMRHSHETGFQATR